MSSERECFIPQIRDKRISQMNLTFAVRLPQPFGHTGNRVKPSLATVGSPTDRTRAFRLFAIKTD